MLIWLQENAASQLQMVEGQARDLTGAVRSVPQVFAASVQVAQCQEDKATKASKSQHARLKHQRSGFARTKPRPTRMCRA